MDNESEFFKGLKSFQKNYKEPEQRLFRVYYDEITGEILQYSDWKFDRSGPYIELPVEDVKEMQQTSISLYLVKNKKLVKKPKESSGLYLKRVYKMHDLDFDKLLYCTTKGQPGILVTTYKLPHVIDFEAYEWYQ